MSYSDTDFIYSGYNAGTTAVVLASINANPSTVTTNWQKLLAFGAAVTAPVSSQRLAATSDTDIVGTAGTLIFAAIPTNIGATDTLVFLAVEQSTGNLHGSIYYW